MKKPLIFLIASFIFIKSGHGQNIRTDSLKVDSLFRLLDRRPSEAELEWVINKLQKSPEQEKITDLLPWITALSAIVGFFLQRKWQLKKDRLERLYSSLQWFEGKTQKRSLGIAMIEANWHKEESFHKTWISILTNQAVYLLLQSEQDDSAHEIANLRRIINLLVIHKNDCSIEELQQLTNALQDSVEREGKPRKKILDGKPILNGLNLSDKNEFDNLTKWREGFA